MLSEILFASVALPLHLVPGPLHIERLACTSGLSAVPKTVSRTFDSGARIELDERWGALRIGHLQTTGANAATIVVRRDPSLPPQAYQLVVAGGRATIVSSDSAGAFYGAMTLAQLPVSSSRGWSIPCVRIDDRPALRWRILSDDVSRGPLPTMRYFEERIRTIAALKMNGYSPYMEHVFVSPTDPLPAPLDGITPEQLHDLATYAAQFHVALIVEQQSFAHMHNTLRLEQYAAAAELPHGFLLAPNAPLSMEYLSRIVAQQLAAVGRPPFFHIGSDETATLGLGQTSAYVAQIGRSQAYAAHVVAMNRLIAGSGARLMLWDDGIENDPSIMRMIPRNAVIVNWHYEPEPSYQRFIRTIAGGGFDQMVAPGASNWNEIYPAIDTAIANERRFIDEAKTSGVLGLFQTVWHDDGETLFESTWYPVAYAAAAAWQSGDVDPAAFAGDFAGAFFAANAGIADDVGRLAQIHQLLEPAHAPYGQTDALFWTDPFDPGLDALSGADLSAVRIAAERVEQDLYFARPPLHANATFVMFLAARRYDVLARGVQIAREVRSMYAQAVSDGHRDPDTAVRDLYWCRYWMWELRDDYEELATLYARAWRYENRESHLAGNLERYHMAAQTAIRRADGFARATRQFANGSTLPPLESILSS